MRVKRTLAEGLAGLALAAYAPLAYAQVTTQVTPAQPIPVWNPVAGYTVSLGLAGPATGAVQSVWYLAAGTRLLAQTESGRVFETADFQHWKLNSSDEVPAAPAKPPLRARPESGIQIGTSGTRRYSVTRENIYGSDDGRLWVNLTGFNGVSIIGDGFSALAVSPANQLDIAAANRFGVWRSLDGGLSWQGLNEDLPNLNARSLAGQREVILADATLAAVNAGKWTAVSGIAPDSALRSALASKYGVNAVAAGQSGSAIYAATPASGTLKISPDEGGTWRDSAVPGAGAIGRIWVDSQNAQAALAVAGSRLYRTTNGGLFWDDVTGALNAGNIHGLTADSSSGVVYAATDRGVFAGRLSLNAADQVPANWTAALGNLPIAAAWDVRLNGDGTLTVLVDGYGVFETPAPHRSLAPRIVNGADMSDRAAAPGSLISVLGASVKQAKSGQNTYPVLIASDQSSQLQVPFEVAPGILQLAVQGDAGGVWMAPLNVKAASPAIFVDADGAPMIEDAASGLVIDAGTPLQAGAVIDVLATGLGRVTPPWPTGVPAPVDSPPAVVAPVTAFLDGTPIRVIRATLAPTFIGNYLVELEIPSIVNRGANELRIVVNGEESNRVRLYLEPGVTVP
jgi:uncharacterized protein (TIGR03437 family)